MAVNMTTTLASNGSKNEAELRFIRAVSTKYITSPCMFVTGSSNGVEGAPVPTRSEEQIGARIHGSRSSLSPSPRERTAFGVTSCRKARVGDPFGVLRVPSDPTTPGARPWTTSRVEVHHYCKNFIIAPKTALAPYKTFVASPHNSYSCLDGAWHFLWECHCAIGH